jgi:hypothetical protein
MRRRAVGAALLAAVFVAGWAAGGEDRGPPGGGKAGGDAASRKERDDFVGGVEKELSAARQRIDQMKRDVVHASGKARADLQAALHSLERQHRVVRSKLSRLKSATAEKWSGLKEGVETDLNKLKQSLHKHDADAT